MTFLSRKGEKRKRARAHAHKGKRGQGPSNLARRGEKEVSASSLRRHPGHLWETGKKGGKRGERDHTTYLYCRGGGGRSFPPPTFSSITKEERLPIGLRERQGSPGRGKKGEKGRETRPPILKNSAFRTWRGGQATNHRRKKKALFRSRCPI